MDDDDILCALILVWFLGTGMLAILLTVAGYQHGHELVYEQLLEQHNVTQPAEEVTEL